MVKISVAVPDEVHHIIRRIQSELQLQGVTKPLRELYAEIVKEGALGLGSQDRTQPTQ